VSCRVAQEGHTAASRGARGRIDDVLDVPDMARAEGVVDLVQHVGHAVGQLMSDEPVLVERRGDGDARSLPHLAYRAILRIIMTVAILVAMTHR